MINRASHVVTARSDLQALCRIGGAAALVAGLAFRRNLGAEIALLSTERPPTAVLDWFALLQTNALLGLAYLNIFDVVNCVLVGLVFLALVVSLWESSRSSAAIAALFGFGGIAVYLASNTALSLLALSDQYVAATDQTQRMLLLAAGQSLLALNRFGVGAHPGSTGYLSLLLVALAGLLLSAIALREHRMGKAVAWVGVGANGLDLGYCLAFALAPFAMRAQLAVLFIPVAGLLFMVWHILLGWHLVTGRIRPDS
jgi:hypothetical protein